MSNFKVLYMNYAPEDVYEIIRSQLPEGFELTTLERDDDRALEIAAEEEKKVKEIKSGHLIPDWVEKTLKERGYVID